MEECKPEQIESLSTDFTNNYISSIKLSNFRNYKSFKANFSPHPIAFIGKNGVGKTNILESISLMQPGRGIRSVKLEEMSYKNRGNFGVYINLERNRNSIQIGSSLDIASSKLRKVKVDGKYISPLGLTEYLGIISLTPLIIPRINRGVKGMEASINIKTKKNMPSWWELTMLVYLWKLW